MGWPNKIEGNEFGLCKLDPDKPMRLKVNTWSNVFGGGGSVSIDGYTDGDQRHYADFGRITVKGSGSVRDEREHMQALVDGFNDDLAVNWRELIENAREYVLDHWKEQRRESNRKITAAKKGVWS